LRALARLRADWVTWLSENLLQGAAAEELKQILVSAGIDNQLAVQAIHEIAENPIFRAALHLVDERNKLIALLRTLGQLLRQELGPAPEIPCEIALTPDVFFKKYYFANRPVIIEGLLKDAPALTKWTLDYFRDHFGEVVIEIFNDRESDPDYEINIEQHRANTRLDEFIAMLEGSAITNDFYLAAQNFALEIPELAALKADIVLPEGFVDLASAGRGDYKFWLGPAGTITPLHHDTTNILFCQVRGRKEFKLISPTDFSFVYNRRGVFSSVDAANPDKSKHPEYERALVLSAVLHPGEVLFIPVGWWHWVRALDISISYTIQSFALPASNVRWEGVYYLGHRLELPNTWQG
jgi:hypothetical protein